MKHPTKRFLKIAIGMMLIGAIATCSLIFTSNSALPERHGRVSSKLFLGKGNNQPLIVGLGGSKGAELALILASYYPEYSTVIAIVPGSAVFPSLTLSMNTSSFFHQGHELPFVPVPWSATPALIKRDLRTAFEKMMENKQAMRDAAIKVENIQGAILFLSATHDEMWPSTEMSIQMVNRLKDAGFTPNVQHIAIEGGHAEPLKHFARIEGFLAATAKTYPR